MLSVDFGLYSPALSGSGGSSLLPLLLAHLHGLGSASTTCSHAGLPHGDGNDQDDKDDEEEGLHSLALGVGSREN